MLSILTIFALGFIFWRTERSIDSCTKCTPFLIRVGLVLICVGSAALIWFSFKSFDHLPWPIHPFAIGGALLLLSNRRIKDENSEA